MSQGWHARRRAPAVLLPGEVSAIREETVENSVAACVTPGGKHVGGGIPTHTPSMKGATANVFFLLFNGKGADAGNNKLFEIIHKDTGIPVAVCTLSVRCQEMCRQTTAGGTQTAGVTLLFTVPRVPALSSLGLRRTPSLPSLPHRHSLAPRVNLPRFRASPQPAPLSLGLAPRQT